VGVEALLTKTTKADLEAVFNSANGAFSVSFPPLFVGPSLLALLASRVGTSSIGENLTRKFAIVKVE